jgi:uncharacterized protein DUF1844
MSDTSESATRPEATQDEMHTALFAQLVMQQNNMAMMLLGKIPHPEEGKLPRNIEAARLFIDQLEMLEAKTKGNLTKEEAALLKQSLMSLRLAFVDAVNSPEPEEKETQQKSPPAPVEPPKASEEESHKKFSKKY